MSLRRRVLIGAAALTGVLGGFTGVAYATGSMPVNLTPAAFMNEAFIANNCEKGDLEWYCPDPGESPDELPVGGGGTMVAFGDSYSAGEGAPASAFTIGCVLDAPDQTPALASAEVCTWDQSRPERWVPVSGFRDGTDNDINACHRSKYAYPFKVAESLGLSLDHRACSGAVSTDYFHTRTDVPEGTPGAGARDWNKNSDGSPLSPQSAVPIPVDTRLVTVGFGGNNVGFSDIIQRCTGIPDFSYFLKAAAPMAAALTADSFRSGRYGSGCTDFVREQQATLATNLGVGTPERIESIQRVFRHARESAPPSARVIAIGYPRVFPKVPTRQCGMGAGDAYMSIEDQAAINAFVADLNNALQQEATAADIDFADIEDLYEVPGSGEDHGLCNDTDVDPRIEDEGDPAKADTYVNDRWITRIRLDADFTNVKSRDGSMHPTEHGHRVSASAVLDCYRDPTLCANYTDRRIKQMDPEWWSVLAYDQAGCISPDQSQSTTSWDTDIAVTTKDVTGDNRAEAVIEVTCPSSTSSWPKELQVWDVTKSEPRLLLAIDDLYFRENATWEVDDYPGITMRGTTLNGDVDASCCATHWGEVRYFWTGSSFLLDDATQIIDPDSPYIGEPSSLQIGKTPLADGRYTSRLAGAGYSGGMYYVVVDPVELTSEEPPVTIAPPPAGAPEDYWCFSEQDPSVHPVQVPDFGICPGPTDLTRLELANGGVLRLLSAAEEGGWGTSMIDAPLSELANFDAQGKLSGLFDIVISNGQVDAVEEVGIFS